MPCVPHRHSGLGHPDHLREVTTWLYLETQVSRMPSAGGFYESCFHFVWWPVLSLFKKILTRGQCLLILERGEWREGGREREREGERNIDRSPLALALTRDRTRNLGVRLTGNQTGALSVWGNDAPPHPGQSCPEPPRHQGTASEGPPVWYPRSRCF